jgi:hypothetical protein
MDANEIEAVLERAERAVAEGRDLQGIGFWRAVASVRRDHAIAERFAERIAAVDRNAFLHAVKLRMHLAFGLAVLVVITAIGVVAVALAERAATAPEAVARLNFHFEPLEIGDLYHRTGFVPITFLIGFGALIIGTHSLTHWIVGRLAGIRFTHVFLGGPPPPRPGVKTDYASYLRASPRARAVMHASGAVVTKIVPFALLSVSLRFYTQWPWLTWILLAVGVVQIVTDVTLSTKLSDWKKARREWRAAKA